MTSRRSHTSAPGKDPNALSRGLLASCLVHEIANPVSYVLGNLEYIESHGLLGESADPELRASLEDALSGARHMAELLRDFRELSCGRPPRTRTVPLAPALELAVRHASVQAADGQARVQVSGAGNTCVVAHRVLLIEVVTNLVSNALQATAAAGRHGEPVHIEVERRLSRAEVRVRDRGVGLAEELRGRLFEPFVTTKEDGLGLGLFLSRRLLQLMGGDLVVQQTSGEGTCFGFELPVG